MTSTLQIVDKIIDLVDEHGFTTDQIGNVISLTMALDDLIHQHYSEIQSNNITDQEWWENTHNNLDNHVGPF